MDLLIEHLHKHADRFAPSQRARLAALMVFVRDQRRIRKLVGGRLSFACKAVLV